MSQPTNMNMIIKFAPVCTLETGISYQEWNCWIWNLGMELVEYSYLGVLTVGERW